MSHQKLLDQTDLISDDRAEVYLIRKQAKDIDSIYMFFRIQIFHLSQEKVLLWNCLEYLNICCQVNISVYGWGMTLAFIGEGGGKRKRSQFPDNCMQGNYVSSCLIQHILEPTSI